MKDRRYFLKGTLLGAIGALLLPISKKDQNNALKFLKIVN